MPIIESRVERAERRLREAEANVARQRTKLERAQARGDVAGTRSGRHVLQSFVDAAVTLRLRLREVRRRHG